VGGNLLFHPFLGMVSLTLALAIYLLAESILELSLSLSGGTTASARQAAHERKVKLPQNPSRLLNSSALMAKVRSAP
jgi:hypothetical protein